MSEVMCGYLKSFKNNENSDKNTSKIKRSNDSEELVQNKKKKEEKKIFKIQDKRLSCFNNENER